MTPLHGDIRGHRYEKDDGQPREVFDVQSGKMVGMGINSSLTVTVSERYCARCGWSEVRGVMGALRWHAEHDEHGGEG